MTDSGIRERAYRLGVILTIYARHLDYLARHQGDTALSKTEESREVLQDALNLCGVRVFLPKPIVTEEITYFFKSEFTMFTLNIGGQLDSLHSSEIGNTFRLSSYMSVYLLAFLNRGYGGDINEDTAHFKTHILRVAQALGAVQSLVESFLDNPDQNWRDLESQVLGYNLSLKEDLIGVVELAPDLDGVGVNLKKVFRIILRWLRIH